MREGGILAQYDTPDQLLAHPADDFVARFVGADRGLKRLALRRLDEIELEPVDGIPPNAPRAPGSTTLRDALSLMMAEGADPLVVVDAADKPMGLLSVARVGRVLSEL
jgi:osmoprotectant transport system ATP-binding protein